MYTIKQSTAETQFFYLHDISGDAVLGQADGTFTKRIGKNGGTAGSLFTAMTVVITEEENGFYSFPLSTSHSDTVGLLAVVFTHATAKQVNLVWRVEARLIDNLAFPATSGRSLAVESDGMVQSTVEEWRGTVPNVLVSNRMDTSVGAMQNNVFVAAAIQDGAFTAAKFNTDSITADALAADAVTEIATNIFTSQMTESYAADGTAPTPAQILFMIWSRIVEIGSSGLTITTRKLDGTTVAMTFTLDSATSPTTITRTT